MMKSINQWRILGVVMLLAITSFQLQAQGTFLIKKSEVVFESETPVEKIRAVNNSVQGAIVLAKNKFLIRVPIQSFTFKRRLQQTHFNENYMESNKFPMATYRGTLAGNYNLSKDGTYSVTTKGDLTIHGVKKTRTIPATIQVKGDQVTLQTSFIVKPKAHGISIPKVVTKKIAEEIKVSINAKLKKR